MSKRFTPWTAQIHRNMKINNLIIVERYLHDSSMPHFAYIVRQALDLLDVNWREREKYK